MKALVYQGLRQMRWDEWPVFQPGPGKALVHVRAVGICGSDLRGTFNYTANAFEHTCQWLVDGCFDPNLLVTHIEPMSEGADIFAHLANNKADGIKYVLTQEAIG